MCLSLTNNGTVKSLLVVALCADVIKLFFVTDDGGKVSHLVCYMEFYFQASLIFVSKSKAFPIAMVLLGHPSAKLE